METELKDITTEADIKVLVDTFYDRINQDALLGPIFNDFAKINWDTHLPIMYNFWSTVLFGSKAYKGQPFPKHLALPIAAEHFNHWLQIFNTNTDAQFAGPNATEIKAKAAGIASMFQYKMEMFKWNIQ